MSRRAVPVDAGAEVEPFDYGGVAVPRGERVMVSAAPKQAQMVRVLSTRSAPAAPAVPAPQVAAPSSPMLEREAFARGYAEGERAGIETAARQLDAQRARLAETLADLNTLRDQLTHRTERQVVELALAIARRIIHREISLDRELLLVMARLALDRLGGVTTATVRLHPDDEAALRGGRAEWPQGEIRLVADASVKPGGCLVSVDGGEVDLGVEAQIGEVSTALLDTRS